MLNDMPVGIPKLVEGSIDLDTFFGLKNVKIISNDSHIPILPVRSKRGLLTPLGTWTGWYFSEELKEAKKEGYQIEIISGISFERGKIFNNYIEKFYEMKVNFKGAKRNFAKLMLNSLYGIMGIQPIMTECKIIRSENVDKNNDIIKLTSLGQDFE